MDRKNIPLLMFVFVVFLILLSVNLGLSMEGGWHISRELTPHSGWDTTFPKDPLLYNNINLYRVLVFVDTWSHRSILDAKMSSMFIHARRDRANLILRFSYRRTQPSMNTIKHDIQHFLPVLKRNRDVIASIQAGWLGRFGEWNRWPILPDGDDGGNAKIRNAKKYVVDAMKQVGVPVQVRYPIDKRLYYHRDSQVNIHDDCLGADVTDSGTFYRGSESGWPWGFNDIGAAKKYMESMPWNGAESCSDTTGVVPDCWTLLRLVKERRIAYLNLDYPYKYRGYAKTHKSCFLQITRALQFNGKR